MMEDIPPENKRYKADEGYVPYLMKILKYKLIVIGGLFWLVTFAFIIPMVARDLPYPLFINVIIVILIDFAALFLCIFLLYLISYPISKWYNTKFYEKFWWAVGDSTIFVFQGVFSTNLARIPFSRIQNLNTKQIFWDRFGDYYRITIETAGSTQYQAEGIIYGVKNPEEIISMISTKMESYRRDTLKDSGLQGIPESKQRSETVLSPEMAESPEITGTPEIMKVLKSIDNHLNRIEEIMKNKN